MKEVIKQILNKLACNHDWELWETIQVESTFGDRYKIFHFVCKKCGKFKKVKSS